MFFLKSGNTLKTNKIAHLEILSGEFSSSEFETENICEGDSLKCKQKSLL